MNDLAKKEPDVELENHAVTKTFESLFETPFDTPMSLMLKKAN